MTIENLARLTNATLLNKPSVSSVLDFVFEARKVARGFAFVAFDPQPRELELAIKNGAYAILSEENLTPIDPEIAYLRVESLQTALMRLMRFEGASRNLKFCLVNAAQHAMLERMHLGKNATLIPREISELFTRIMHAKSGDLFFGSDVRVLQRLTPLYDAIYTDRQIQVINPSSIFFTTMICDDVYYQNLNVPRVFVGSLCGLLHYLRENSVEFRLGDMRQLGHFEPIFIDKNFRPISFGASFRALIIENDEELFEIEAVYLSRNFDKKETIICLPSSSDINIQDAFRFENLSEIKALRDFRYALVLCEKAEILAVLNESETQNSLFDF